MNEDDVIKLYVLVYLAARFAIIVNSATTYFLARTVIVFYIIMAAWTYNQIRNPPRSRATHVLKKE